MIEQSIMGVYGSMAEAEEAVTSLNQGGFPITQVSIVAQDLPGEKEGHGGIEWAATAVSQLLLGGLGGWGVSRQHILKYEAYLQDGKYLVIAHGSAEQTAQAQTILRKIPAEALNVHQQVAD